MPIVGPSTTREKVYMAVMAHWRKEFRPPTLREICDATGITSTSVVNFHLKILDEMQVIVLYGGARGAVPVSIIDKLCERDTHD